MRSPIQHLAGAIVIATATSASAYPTSVVFAPTGDTKGPGDVSAMLYAGMDLTPSDAPAPTWVGMNVGLVPRIAYGDSGLSFGGLEIGVDALVSDLSGTPDAFVKPMFNAKLQLVTEAGWVPNVSIGAMGFAPFHLQRSMNLLFGSTTKTIATSQAHYGRVTLGLGGVLNHPGADPYKDSHPVFYATAPFSRDSRLLLLGGYESPAFGPFSIAIDYIGGYSELSSTNIALNLMATEGGAIGIGGFLGNDPDAFYAGVFAYLSLQFNAGKVLRSAS